MFPFMSAYLQAPDELSILQSLKLLFIVESTGRAQSVSSTVTPPAPFWKVCNRKHQELCSENRCWVQSFWGRWPILSPHLEWLKRDYIDTAIMERLCSVYVMLLRDGLKKGISLYLPSALSPRPSRRGPPLPKTWWTERACKHTSLYNPDSYSMYRQWNTDVTVVLLSALVLLSLLWDRGLRCRPPPGNRSNMYTRQKKDPSSFK